MLSALCPCFGSSPKSAPPHTGAASPKFGKRSPQPEAALMPPMASPIMGGPGMEALMANRPNPLDQLPAPSQKKLLDVYERGSKLGSGTFAEVYEVTNKATGEKYALKTMRKRKLKGREKVIVREIEVLAKLAAHPNIVGLVAEDGFFETDDAYHLVMELCTGKELFDSIVERGFYSERDAVNVIAQVLDAIKFCHDQGVVHRDLKPENLLLKDNSANARVMVADFGLSRLAEFDNQMFMTACGTPAYCAPEIILNKGHAMPVDMWSLGCIAYVILCGYIPFWAETQRGVFDEIVKCRYTFDPEYWSAISADAKDFIAKLLVVDPALRMSADQALEHPWIQRASKSQRPGLVRPPKSLADTTSSISASSASIDAVNLVPTLKRVQKSHPAREKFKGAVNAIMLASQMQARRTSAGSVEGADDVSAPIAVDDSVTDISRPFVATASAPSLPVLPERK